MKTIGKKVSYVQTPEKLLININGRGTKKQVNLVILWLLLWTICGTILVVELFADYSGQQKIVLAVMVAFWLYFEYAVYYIYRWRKGGIEILKIQGDTMTYSREINGVGKVQTFDARQVRNLKMVDYEDSDFQRAYYKSWYSIGGEMVQFTINGREHRVAMQIEEDDAKKLLKLIDKALPEISSQ